MESPRSSLLSTLVMTLPLVVVPAIALLRPPLPDSGASTTALSAGEDDDFFSQLDVFEETYTTPSEGTPSTDEAEDEFDEWFEEEDPPGSNPPSADSSVAPVQAPGDADPFVPEGDPATPSGGDVADSDPGSRRSGQQPPPQRAELSEQELMQQISAAGVRRTIWFSPGPQRVGFAAFVPGRNSAVTYRFESVANSRLDALNDVVQQLARWQLKQQSRNARP